MSDITHDSSGFMSGLTIGLILGAAGSHYLNNTDQGKELLVSLKDKAGEALEQIKDNPALAGKIAELEKTMEVAKATINAAAGRVADATEPKKPAPKKNFFQKMGSALGK